MPHKQSRSGKPIQGRVEPGSKNPDDGGALFPRIAAANDRISSGINDVIGPNGLGGLSRVDLLGLGTSLLELTEKIGPGWAQFVQGFTDLLSQGTANAQTAAQLRNLFQTFGVEIPEDASIEEMIDVAGEQVPDAKELFEETRAGVADVNKAAQEGFDKNFGRAVGRQAGVHIAEENLFDKTSEGIMQSLEDKGDEVMTLFDTLAEELVTDAEARKRGEIGTFKTGQERLEQNLQDRLTRNMAFLAGQGQGERRDINRRFGDLNTETTRRLINQGLGNTTVGASLRRGNERASTESLGDLNERLNRQRLGVDERLSGDIATAISQGNVNLSNLSTGLSADVLNTKSGIASDRLGLTERISGGMHNQESLFATGRADLVSGHGRESADLFAQGDVGSLALELGALGGEVDANTRFGANQLTNFRNLLQGLNIEGPDVGLSAQASAERGFGAEGGPESQPNWLGAGTGAAELGIGGALMLTNAVAPGVGFFTGAALAGTGLGTLNSSL